MHGVLNLSHSLQTDFNEFDISYNRTDYGIILLFEGKAIWLFPCGVSCIFTLANNNGKKLNTEGYGLKTRKGKIKGEAMLDICF